MDGMRECDCYNYFYSMIVSNCIWLLICSVIIYFHIIKVRKSRFVGSNLFIFNKMLITIYQLLILGRVDEVVSFLKECLSYNDKENENVLDDDE